MTVVDAESTARAAEVVRSTFGRAEQAFGLTPVSTEGRGVVSGSMARDTLPVGVDGQPSAGAIGVLADHLLGVSMITASNALAWSVSVEIALDFLAPLPAADTGFHVAARGADVDGLVGYAHGEVRDDTGRILVAARQHGRYVAGPAVLSPVSAAGCRAPGESVLELLGARVSTVEGGRALAIDDPARWLNPLDALHGGVAICAAEAVATYATLDSPVPLRTTSLSIAFARPMRGAGPFLFLTRTRHTGKTLRIVDVTGLADDIPRSFVRVIRQVVPAGG